MAALLDLRPADGAVGSANIVAELKHDLAATLSRQQAAPPVLLRRSRDGVELGRAADLQALAPWCRGHVLAVLRERAQGR